MLTKQTEASEDENGKPIVKDNRINCLSAYVNGLYGEKETNWTTVLKNKSVFSYKKCTYLPYHQSSLKETREP